MLPELTVSLPEVKYEAAGPGPGGLALAALEKPVEVSGAATIQPGGVPFGLEHLAGGQAGFFIYRQAAAAASQELWDGAASTWRSLDASLFNLVPEPLLPQDGGWKGLLVAAGKQDGAGNPAFTAQAGGYPRYTVRNLFRAKVGEETLLTISGESPAWGFVSAQERMRAGVAIQPEDPAQADRVQLFLRSAALQPAGKVEIRDLGGAQIEIANFAAGGALLAVVRLTPGGAIRLIPAAGQQVTIEGDLEAERITYRPGGGGPKVVLP